jgi:hypothetical protein
VDFVLPLLLLETNSGFHSMSEPSFTDLFLFI